MVVLLGRAIVSAREETHFPLRAARSKGLMIRSFSPVGGGASFSAIIRFRRELTSSTCFSLKRRGYKKLAGTSRFRLMEGRRTIWMWLTMPEGMTSPQRKYLPTSRQRATEQFT